MTARAGDANASFRQSLEGSERQEAMELPSKPAAVLVSQITFQRLGCTAGSAAGRVSAEPATVGPASFAPTSRRNGALSVSSRGGGVGGGGVLAGEEAAEALQLLEELRTIGLFLTPKHFSTSNDWLMTNYLALELREERT